MKRYISAMLCAVMLTAYVVPVQAAVMTNCTHENYAERVEDGGIVGYTYRDDKYHIARAIKNYFCTNPNCGLLTRTEVVDVIAAHNHSILYSDLGHVSTFVHRYIYKCPCGSEIIRDVACSPGCLG